MSRVFVGSAMTGLVVIAASCVTAAAATTPGWHTAQLTAHSPAPFVDMNSIACPSAGTCVAGGSYGPVVGVLGDRFAMVVGERHGVWQPATEIALPADASVDQTAQVSSVTCTSPGACVAVGSYSAGTGVNGFIATESHGTWSAAVSVQLPANTQTPPNAGLTSVSCAAPGACVAVGGYAGNAPASLPMVVTESGGTWHQATVIRVLAKSVKPDVQVTVESLSCPARGWCAALGSVFLPTGAIRSLGLTDTRGQWRAAAIRLPQAADPRFGPSLNWLSCAKAGTCMALGRYLTSSLRGLEMTETLAHGTWQRAVAIMPPKPRPADWPDWLGPLSCAGRSCVAVGTVDTRSGGDPWVSLTYRAGSWGQASRIPFPPGALKSAGLQGGPRAMACVSGGTCTTVGDYAAPGPYHDLQGAAATRR